jgi:hypothetical protein
MQITHVQLDELYAVLRAVKDGELGEDEAIKHLERYPHWVWTAMDPERKLLVAIDVGARTVALAQRVVHQVTQRLAPDCIPMFLSDGFREYLRRSWGILACGFPPSAAKTEVRYPSPVGCPCPSCAMRKW